MKKKVDPDSPAFPIVTRHLQHSGNFECNPGVSTRTYIATKLMGSMVSNTQMTEKLDPEDIAYLAQQSTDLLIKELNKLPEIKDVQPPPKN